MLKVASTAAPVRDFAASSWSLLSAADHQSQSGFVKSASMLIAMSKNKRNTQKREKIIIKRKNVYRLSGMLHQSASRGLRWNLIFLASHVQSWNCSKRDFAGEH